MAKSTAATIESPQVQQEQHQYKILPTLLLFHNSSEPYRCIVGPVGSGKTTAAAFEICSYLPDFLCREYGIRQTRWVIIRNTYVELRDTTIKTVGEWFPRIFESPYWSEGKMTGKGVGDGWEAEIMFRSCDRPEHIKKLKSLEITGYWIDESIEVPEEIKRMLKNRVGRFPRQCPERYGVETTNPPDVEHPTYSQFRWHVPPPGPLPPREPLEGHAGFWQPPYENVANLPPGYYEELRLAYRDNPDWIQMYIEGKPGVMMIGKLVYNNFRREYHVAKEPIPWTGGELFVGWDNSGNVPACVVLQVPSPMRAQVLREYHHDKMNIVDFTRYVVGQLNREFPGAKDVMHWADPAGNQQFPNREGGFTSNAALMAECGVEVGPSEQNFQARVEAVDQMLGRIDGVLIDPSCTRLINGFLGGYCYPPNKSLMGEFLPNVLKNKYSHVHDALQYVMVRMFKADLRPDARDPILNLPYRNVGRDQYDPLAGTGYDPFSWK